MITLGAVTAAIAGLVVGLPSLRLRGDYLAIVTLGFGEIIRIVVQNQPALGGSIGADFYSFVSHHLDGPACLLFFALRSVEIY